jgi:hypothetical protein
MYFILILILILLFCFRFKSNFATINKVTIILTCTVNIHDNIAMLVLKNPDERKTIYLKSIRNWLNNSTFNIIVVENSGYSFPELKQELVKFRDRFEIISFKNPKSLKKEQSKGISELYAINYVYSKSKIIKQLDNDSMIIKITGRYYIPQLEKYLLQNNTFDIISQNNPNNCEMIGCKKKYFNELFNQVIEKQFINKNPVHIENVYEYRKSRYPNVLQSILFNIEPTKNGGYGVLRSTL